jgi:hypothetical protein
MNSQQVLIIILYVENNLQSYNDSQQATLFLNFIMVKNSKYRGQIHCPSSGVLILYSQQQVFFILVTLTVCWRGQDGRS